MNLMLKFGKPKRLINGRLIDGNDHYNYCIHNSYFKHRNSQQLLECWRWLHICMVHICIRNVCHSVLMKSHFRQLMWSHWCGSLHNWPSPPMSYLKCCLRSRQPTCLSESSTHFGMMSSGRSTFLLYPKSKAHRSCVRSVVQTMLRCEYVTNAVVINVVYIVQLYTD